MQTRWQLLAVVLCLAMATLCSAADTTVHKLLDSFDPASWTPSQYNRAVGTLSTTNGQAPDKHCLQLDVKFTGPDFEWCAINPNSPRWIPGNAKDITLRSKCSDNRYPIKVTFLDGWGRDKVDGQALELDVKNANSNEWTTSTLTIPDNWIRPIRVSGITTHNWNARQPNNIQICLENIEAQTDISQVDPKTGRLKTWRPDPAPADPAKPAPEPLTPLVSTSLSPASEHNVFVAQAPTFNLAVQSWLSAPLAGKVSWKVLDDKGIQVATGTQDLHVTDLTSIPITLKVPHFGWYDFQVDGSLSGGSSLKTAQPLAYLPKPIALSEPEKDASPYGLNVLAARKPMVGVFRNAGIIWYRDYGFDYDWMVRAKGADKSYSGWPWYPQMIKMYDSYGVRVLACLKSAIKPPRPDQPNGLEPDAAWRREMISIVTAFPSIHYYELDNEYDLSFHGAEKVEVATEWKNYRAYHRVFGQIVDLVSAGEYVAVENGRSGIWPNRVKACVEKGDFEHIQVVNTHHYTGTEPPEINVTNHNAGVYESEAVLSFFDQLRANKAAAASDGKKRQHWLTEFGWDTKAGPVVTPFQQAIYLSRGYMLTMAAGCEKAFWFFDIDAPEGGNFFDGCGLMTEDQLPRLGLCAIAGLTQILPRPQFVGMINAGDGTAGYLFRNDGKLVATLFTIEKPTGPTVNFGPAKIYDYLSNPIENPNVTLTPAPVFAVGISEDSTWFRQSAYMLKSPYLVSATSGDTLTTVLQVRNDRKTPIHGTVRLELPAGWTADNPSASISAEPGKSIEIPISFHIDTKEPLGEKTAYLLIDEDQPLIRIPLRVQTRQPIEMTVRGLRGQPGQDSAAIRLLNCSTKTLEGSLQFQLPGTWSTPNTSVAVKALKPMETREVTCPVTWTTDWKPNERAAVKYTTDDGRSVEQPLIPTCLAIHQVSELPLDGNLASWPDSTRLPSWALGSTAGTANADIRMAWSEKGLYIAAQVSNSKASVPDPKNFWDGDCLEVFLDTHNNKTKRKFEPGDHQFWIAPLVDQKKAYLGQWKCQAEIPQTLYDIPGIQSFSARTTDGYIMEILIPAAQIQQYQPKAGSSIGLNLNLDIIGPKGNREVFWTLPKSEGAHDQPATWGSVLLTK